MGYLLRYQSESTELAESHFLPLRELGLTQGPCEPKYHGTQLYTKQPRSNATAHTTLDTGRCSHMNWVLSERTQTSGEAQNPRRSRGNVAAADTPSARSLLGCSHVVADRVNSFWARHGTSQVAVLMQCLNASSLQEQAVEYPFCIPCVSTSHSGSNAWTLASETSFGKQGYRRRIAISSIDFIPCRSWLTFQEQSREKHCGHVLHPRRCPVSIVSPHALTSRGIQPVYSGMGLHACCVAASY